MSAFHDTRSFNCFNSSIASSVIFRDTQIETRPALLGSVRSLGAKDEHGKGERQSLYT